MRMRARPFPLHLPPQPLRGLSNTGARRIYIISLDARNREGKDGEREANLCTTETPQRDRVTDMRDY